MDINDLFDGIAEAFRRYQKEIADAEGALPTRFPLDLGMKRNLKKRKKNCQQRR